MERKQMFGWPCAFVNGNLFAGLHKQRMIFRLPEKDQAAFLHLERAAQFEPMPGRRMKGYVILATPEMHDRNDLSDWLRRSLAYASDLPAKAKRKTKRAAKSAAKRK